MAKEYIQPTDEQIRTRAYYLWEADGKPHGQDWQYWLKAKEQLEREINMSNSNAPARKTASTTAASEPKKRTASRSPVYA